MIASKNLRTYLTNPVECWARAYSQLIAHESGDRILGKEIADLQAGDQYYTQWPKEDFEPVAQSIRNIIKAYQW